MVQTVLRALLNSSFAMWEALGVHVMPDHFESPIPNTGRLKPATWSKRSALVGIDVREREQIQLLETFTQAYKPEYECFPRGPTANPQQYYVDNRFFESVDGEVLYCMVRQFKPRRIYEVGCGNSTLLAAQALLHNESDGAPPAQLVAFEPFPNANLKRGFPGLSKLVTSRVEDVEPAVFQELGENDILFLDSSHVVRIGGDVQYEFLEILPNLNPGVIVHVHDIFLPADYPKTLVMRRRRFFSEQYLLQAFLTFNCKFEVLWAASFMHLNHPDLLEAAFDSYNKDARWPGSFWMRRARD